MAIKKFQDLQVEHPQRYEVTDNAGTENLKTIKFSPGKVYQEGTKETAVIFNNIQKNGLYTVIGTRVIEGTEEIYDVELEGLEEFGIFDINLQLVANSKNTTNSPKLRILNEKYSFVNNYGTISIGDLAVNNIYIVKIDTVKKTAFLTESDKLQKGTYLGKADDLKTEIDLNLVKILGLEFGGELNNNNLKQAGKAYWDNVSKSIYKCLVNTTLNYADALYFEALSNDDLLNKLQILDNMLKASEVVKSYKEQWFFITEYANGDKVLLGEYRINEGDGNVENTVALPVWATNANAREAQCYLVGALPQTQHISTFTIYGNTLHILYGGSGLAVGAYVRFLIRFNKI